MRIAIDAMGGDHAPQEIVKGAVLAAKRFPDVTLLLVGLEDKVREELEKSGGSDVDNIEVIHASQVVGMDESPVASMKEKRDSSIVKIADILKQGDAQAMISMGNTGVFVAAATLRLRHLEGIKRSGIAVPLPSANGPCIIIDAGANVATKPEHLVDYAVMATAYAKDIFGIEKPRVGLLSVGEEEAKGNNLTKEALPLLKKLPLNFIGNVEGRDFFNGTVDAVLCDGFVGNAILKAVEGLGGLVLHTLVGQAKKAGSEGQPDEAQTLHDSITDLRKRLDYAEYGGAVLLGVNGVAIVGHGRSNARALENSVRVAREAIMSNLTEHIVDNIKQLPVQ